MVPFRSGLPTLGSFTRAGTSTGKRPLRAKGNHRDSGHISSFPSFTAQAENREIPGGQFSQHSLGLGEAQRTGAKRAPSSQTRDTPQRFWGTLLGDGLDNLARAGPSGSQEQTQGFSLTLSGPPKFSPFIWNLLADISTFYFRPFERPSSTLLLSPPLGSIFPNGVPTRLRLALPARNSRYISPWALLRLWRPLPPLGTFSPLWRPLGAPVGRLRLPCSRCARRPQTISVICPSGYSQPAPLPTSCSLTIPPPNSSGTGPPRSNLSWGPNHILGSSPPQLRVRTLCVSFLNPPCAFSATPSAPFRPISARSLRPIPPPLYNRGSLPRGSDRPLSGV